MSILFIFPSCFASVRVAHMSAHPSVLTKHTAHPTQEAEWTEKDTIEHSIFDASDYEEEEEGASEEDEVGCGKSVHSSSDSDSPRDDKENSQRRKFTVLERAKGGNRRRGGEAGPPLKPLGLDELEVPLSSLCPLPSCHSFCIITLPVKDAA